MPGFYTEGGHIGGDKEGGSDDPRVQIPAHTLQSGAEEGIRRAAYHAALFPGICQDLSRLCQSGGKGLLAEQMLARTQNLFVQLHMELRGCQVDYDFNVRILKQLPGDIGLGDAEFIRQGPGQPPVDVCHCPDIQRLVELLNIRDIGSADYAGTQNSNAVGTQRAPPPIGHIAHLLLWILFLSEHIVPKKPWRCFSDSPWFLGISCDFGKGILPKKLPDFRD